MACSFLQRSIMKLATLIARIQVLRPSQYDEQQLTEWVNEVEAQVVETILNRASGNNIQLEPYDIAVDAEKELLVPDENCDLYLHYLAAKIDFWNAELDRYNNDVAMYSASWQTFASKYRRTHIPKVDFPPIPEVIWPDPLRS